MVLSNRHINEQKVYETLIFRLHIRQNTENILYDLENSKVRDGKINTNVFD